MVLQCKVFRDYIDDKLNWKPDIEYIASKLSRVIYLLKGLTLCIPRHFIMPIFNQLLYMF